MESQTQESVQETPAPKKSTLPYFIAGALIILLAGAAFVAMRYFIQKNPDSSMFGMDGGPVLSFEGPGGAQQTFKLDIEPAEELPKTQPEAMGIFVERKDNSVFIGTGDVSVMVSNGGADSEPDVDTNYSGDKVEVVISNETIVYHETTEMDPEHLEEKIQQTVELGTIDDITPQSSITVWGRKAGDRIIADVILFSTPFLVRGNGASK